MENKERREAKQTLKVGAKEASALLSEAISMLAPGATQDLRGAHSRAHLAAEIIASAATAAEKLNNH